MTGKKIGVLRQFLLGVLLLAIVWQGPGCAEAAPAPAETQNRLVIEYLTTKVPEIQQMARDNPKSRLALQVESTPQAEAEDRFAREYFQVYVGFTIQDGGPGHRSRWATFLVHKDLNEILWANYLSGNSYVPLEDWRKYINPARAEAANDWMCIPYLRVGPIEPNSTIGDLIKTFGAANVERQNICGAECVEKFDVSVIFPGTSNELIVFWQDNQYGKVPSSVSIRKAGSKWKTVHGIRIGTTLAELNRINGRPFTFYGFGWDYGGVIDRGWRGGKMASFPEVYIVLKEARQLPETLYGDKTLRSDMEELLPDAANIRRIDVQLR